LIRRSVAVVAAVLLSGACATKGDFVDLRATMLAELRTLHARQDSLADQVEQLGAELTDSLSASDRRALTGRVEIGRRLDEMKVLISRLTELTGQSQRRLSALRERMETADEHGAGDGARDGVAGTSATPEVPAGAGMSEPRSLYEAALRQFRRGSFGTARAGLAEFLERYPNHELAADALFYVGETYARTSKPDSALATYARVLELYPSSRRAPSALFKSGRIEQSRGNTDDARAFFTRVVRGYPDSDEAALANEELGRLRQ